MIGVVLAVAVIAGAVFVALRRARPVGVVLDPWTFILGVDWRRRFEMNLPETGEDVCGAVPPADVLREIHPASVTACYYKPHPIRPGIAHVGAISGRSLLATSYTWIEPGDVVPRATYRLAWWRKLLIRLASS